MLPSVQKSSSDFEPWNPISLSYSIQPSSKLLDSLNHDDLFTSIGYRPGHPGFDGRRMGDRSERMLLDIWWPVTSVTLVLPMADDAAGYN